MARTARKKSESGIYRVVLRGTNRLAVFKSDDDKEEFLKRLIAVKAEFPFNLYAYCFMDDHVQLLIKETGVAINRVFSRLTPRFAIWYNRTHDRTGILFMDRYKSEPVIGDSRLLESARHIHKLPVNSGLVKGAGEYKWSSYGAYLNGESLVDVEPVLSMLGGREGFIRYMDEAAGEAFSDFEGVSYISDSKLMKHIEKIYAKYNITDIAGVDKATRNEIVRKIRKVPGSSMRQIAELTGLTFSVVRSIVR